MTTEAAPQPSDFTATFTIKVTGLRTTTVNGLENTVKQVSWTLVGEEAGQKFELPQTTDLGDPTSEGFIPLVSLTEVDVVAWIENTDTRIPGIKAHIQYVLDREVAKMALAETPVPWAPATPSTPAQEPAPV